MEVVPDTLLGVIKHYALREESMPLSLVRLYGYQMLKGLAYIHGRGVCHRDIKPHNILANRATSRVLICDFGSAKRLIPDEPNIAYICSRCYRAPELILGCRYYSTAVDMWSMGCVLAEMVTGSTLFMAGDNTGLLASIASLLGSPSKHDLAAMDSHGKEPQLPRCSRKDLGQVLRRSNKRLLDLLSKILVYNPKERLSAATALDHPFFEEVRKGDPKK